MAGKKSGTAERCLCLLSGRDKGFFITFFFWQRGEKYGKEEESI